MASEAYHLLWEDGSETGWNFWRKQGYAGCVAFELQRVPDFATPRFKPLGEKLDERRSEVARRQMQMLRLFHGLGPQVSISFRLRRAGSRLRLFVIARLCAAQPVEPSQIDALASRLQGMFPNEYTLTRITQESDTPSWDLAFDLSWVRVIDEVFKPEDRLRAHILDYFYVAMRWQPQSNNTLEQLCRTLLRFEGDAAIDLTLIPTSFGIVERDWLSMQTQEMREQLTGKRLMADRSRASTEYPPLPHLQAPLENNQDILKHYPQSRLFLTSVRTLGSCDPASITQALIAGATRSPAQILRMDGRHQRFSQALEAARSCSITPEIHPALWDQQRVPRRAQRFHRLADLDELVGFWRLPIPLDAGFPGFELDTGLGDGNGEPHRNRGSELVHLGILADDPALADAPARFEREGLAKHGLIVGVPGSGKTTAVFSILHQLWPRDMHSPHVPFMVLEPAKNEYRALKRIPPFDRELLVFTLGDERISPFRFNPFEVLPGIPLESHIARLNACFTGAFNLFDPLPLLLDHAIRRTYEAAGWYDDSVGGEPGLEAPTLGELCHHAREVARLSGYSDRARDDFNAALSQRLESLRRGSKGRMLDTPHSLPFDDLMRRPVVLELDALNDDEKALIMMFVLSFVYEHARSDRTSGSPLSHVLVVEEAHNLIGRGGPAPSEHRANPREQAIHLFTRMLAEMRALGQGILIADQLPTALAPEAMKQTNLKILMRMTAMDDRQEMGNTMDLDEAQIKDVTHFKSGQAYVFLEAWDRVRRVQMVDFKTQRGLAVPQGDHDLKTEMAFYEQADPERFMPFPECPIGCIQCRRRVRSQAEQFARTLAAGGDGYLDEQILKLGGQSACLAFRRWTVAEALRLQDRHGYVDPMLPFCAYLHLLHSQRRVFDRCRRTPDGCLCASQGRETLYQQLLAAGRQVAAREAGPAPQPDDKIQEDTWNTTKAGSKAS